MACKYRRQPTLDPEDLRPLFGVFKFLGIRRIKTVLSEIAALMCTAAGSVNV